MLREEGWSSCEPVCLMSSGWRTRALFFLTIEVGRRSYTVVRAVQIWSQQVEHVWSLGIFRYEKFENNSDYNNSSHCYSGHFVKLCILSHLLFTTTCHINTAVILILQRRDQTQRVLKICPRCHIWQTARLGFKSSRSGRLQSTRCLCLFKQLYWYIICIPYNSPI